MGSRLPGTSDLNCKPRGSGRSCRSSKIPPSTPASANGFPGGRPGSTVEGDVGGAEKVFN